ncbi:MAG: protein kinase [Myxococcales bacterium]|nr:protein kinase [Myxococcales bacterium]
MAYVDARELVESGGDTLLGARIAGRFTILSRLGSGSMGAVYRAHQDAVGRDVALKIVRAERAYDSETKARFEREARATSALVSPHTVTVFDFGEAADGSWFLAMELLEGETLGERLRKIRRFSVPDAVRIARQAAVSLGEAHGKGIIHRDLKPDNLFLTLVPVKSGEPEEIVKVLDFGIAKLVRGDDQRVDQLETQAGTVFGTPRYMSPEQAQGAPLDARTDVYSLGVILYQMLVGRPPFVDDDAVVVMASHIKEDPPWFGLVAPEARIHPEVEAVVRRALSKEPERRQQSADQLVAELDAALAQTVGGTGLHATSWVGPPAGRRSGSRAAMVIGGAMGLVVIAAGAFLLVRRSSEPNIQALAASAPATVAPSAALAPPAATSASSPAVDPAPSASADAGAAPRASRKPPRRPLGANPELPAPKADGYGKFD